MKRWIHASENINDFKILFNDKIVIDLDLSQSIAASDYVDKINEFVDKVDYDKFPGEVDFAINVKKILEDEYKFTIVKDSKGRFVDISPNEEGTSIYFDAIYDLANYPDLALRRGASRYFEGTNVGIGLAVEIRISDHRLNKSRNANFDDYAKQEVEHIQKEYPSVKHKIEDQQVVHIDERDLYMEYSAALSQFKSDLEDLIRSWAKKIKDEIGE